MKRKDINIIKTLITVAVAVPFFLIGISYFELQLEKAQRQPTKVTLCNQEDCTYLIPKKYKVNVYKSSEKKVASIIIYNIRTKYNKKYSDGTIIWVNTHHKPEKIEINSTEKNKFTKSKTINKTNKNNYFYFFDKSNDLSIVSDNEITFSIRKKIKNEISLLYHLERNEKTVIDQDAEIMKIFESFKVKE